MSEPFDTLALYDSLEPDERAELDRAMQENPALAEAFMRWNSLRASVRKELAQNLPDRALLVLYALAEDDVLDVAEQRRLDAARDKVDFALQRHPGLVDAVKRIRQDRDAFNAAWSAHVTKNGQLAAVAKNQDRPPMRLVHTRKVSRWIWRVAAMIAVVLAGTLMTYLIQRDAGFDTIRATQQMAVDLPDGSSVELAEGSVLMVAEAGSERREARLMSGQALFDIRLDETNPFVVETPNATVTVLGTSFGMHVTQVQTDVVLVSGSVAFASHADRSNEVTLEPGQQSSVVALEMPSQPQLADVNVSLNWTGDLFIRAEPLSAIAQRLSDAFDTPVEVALALASEMVSSTRVETEAGLESALRELALALGAEVVPVEGGGYRVQ